MAKLFPPIIEGTIPAFYSSGVGIVNITIPFSMNRAVNKSNVTDMVVKIKTLQSSTYFYSSEDDDSCVLNFNTTGICNINLIINNLDFVERFRVGQFYKFQIAYKNNNEIGYYSSVAIGKYTKQPSIYIEGLSEVNINDHVYSYNGYYKNDDQTENVYTYRFDLYDNLHNIVQTSGDLIHNSNNNEEPTESINTFVTSLDLGSNVHYLQYHVTTTNGITLETPKYALKQASSISMDVNGAILEAVVNNVANENGYINLSFYSPLAQENINGDFILYRADEKSNYQNWEKCYQFSINGNKVNMKDFWQDFAIEHGIKYKYAISQFNNYGLYSEKIESNIVHADFEDCFLYDGKKQLRIRFNPKVSSFKNNNLETKIETIGSKHPFILRNGSVSYKEFPISGLISYLMDIDNLFIQDNYKKLNFKRGQDKTLNTLIPSYTQTALVFDNIIKEKNFKMEVLSWLTNGEPKIFKSPTEGNFIVRLLNVSLTPHDNLGRMLHTFNCTAYEIAEYNYENLNNLGIISINNLSTKTNLYWKTIELADKQINKNILPVTAQSIEFIDMNPNDLIEITFANSGTQTIQVGVTGVYQIHKNIPITSVSLITPSRGLMNYSFYEIQENGFSTFKNLEIIEVPCRQFIGYHNIIKELTYVNSVQNPKVEIEKIVRIKATPRPVVSLWKDTNDMYHRIGSTGIISLSSLDKLTLYEVYNDINGNSKRYYLDLYTNTIQDNYDPNITIKTTKIAVNNDLIFEWETPQETLNYLNIKSPVLKADETIIKGETFTEIEKNILLENEIFQQTDFKISGNLYEYTGKFDIMNLIIGNGVIAEISYVLKNSEYAIETQEIYNVYNTMQEYNKSISDLSYLVNNIPGGTLKPDEIKNITNEIQSQVNLIKQNYITYITTLVNEQNRKKKVEGRLDVDK